MRLSLFLSLFLSFSFSFSRSLNVTRARHSRLATEGEGSRNARALFLLLSRSGLNREEREPPGSFDERRGKPLPRSRKHSAFSFCFASPSSRYFHPIGYRDKDSLSLGHEQLAHALDRQLDGRS